MMRVLLVRHAQAAFDQDDYDRLSPLGWRQAARLGAWWRAESCVPDAVWTGGLRRQVETARACLAALAAQGQGMPPLRVEPALREFDHREIFYRHRPDLLDAAALARWKQESADYSATFAQTYGAALARWMDGRFGADYAESWPQFQARCLGGVSALIAAAVNHGHGCIAVFTSAGPISTIIQACRDVPDAQLAALQSSLANTGVTELQVVPSAASGAPVSTWQLHSVNATPHLASCPQDLSWR